MVFEVTLKFKPSQWKRVRAYFEGEAMKLNLTLEQTLQLALLNYIESYHLSDEAHGLINLYMSIHNLDDERKAVSKLIKAGFKALEGKPLTEFQKEKK